MLVDVNTQQPIKRVKHIKKRRKFVFNYVSPVVKISNYASAHQPIGSDVATMQQIKNNSYWLVF